MQRSTSFEDMNVNANLALSVGYASPNLRLCEHLFAKTFEVEVLHNGQWLTFDYQDPKTIWPIAKRYNVFPWQINTFQGHAAEQIWASNVRDRTRNKIATITAPTAELAVARAVIEGAGRGCF
jgi:hypothetical protein